jgi:hypothetical protein
MTGQLDWQDLALAVPSLDRGTVGVANARKALFVNIAFSNEMQTRKGYLLPAKNSGNPLTHSPFPIPYSQKASAFWTHLK